MGFQLATLPASIQPAHWSLLWISQCTWPEISFVVNKIAQLLQYPSIDHWNAALFILFFLLTTKDIRLKLGCSNLTLIGFLDLDLAEDRDYCLFLLGYTLKLGHGFISWWSKKQPTVSMSSSKAEYKALSNC